LAYWSRFGGGDTDDYFGGQLAKHVVFMSERWTLTILVLIACGLLLPHLGAQCLNRQEATFALLAQRVLRHGLPYAQDTDGIITQEWGHDFNRYGVWTLTPWLCIYLCAASIKILGLNALASRLPFALAGIISVVLIYRTVRRLGYSVPRSFAVALILLVNVQFLLFCRRVGAHALAILIATLLFANELSPNRKSRQVHRKKCIQTGVLMGLLLHVDYWVGLLQLSGLMVFWLYGGWQAVRQKARPETKHIVSTLGIAILFAMPMALYTYKTGGFPIRVLHQGDTFPAFRVMYPLAGIWEASQFLLGPLVLVTVVWVLLTRGELQNSGMLRYPVCVLAGTVAAYYILLRLFALPARYLFFAHVLPAYSFLLGEILHTLTMRRAFIAWSLVVLLFGTNFGEIWLPWLAGIDAANRHFVPPVLRSHLLTYAKELWQVPSGPVDRLVDSPLVRSRRGAVFFASAEAEPLMFHLRVKVLRRLPFDQLPDVVVLRTGWLCDYDRVLVDCAWQARPAQPYRVSWQRMPNTRHMEVHCNYVNTILKRYSYTRYALPATEHWQQNSDETRTRYYCPDEGLREVIVWLRGTELPLQ
jgi:hypothetical protein